VGSEGLPIWSLVWIVQSWAAGLNEPARSEFLSLRLGDLQQQSAPDLLGRAWVTGLSAEKNMELAAATHMKARKPT
jgi:hypothetical protein